MQIIIITVVLLLIFFGAGYKKELNDKKAYAKSLIDDYGKKNKRKYTAEELKSIKGYCEYHKSENMIDDITWNDLDMNIIYCGMNYCKSSAGDEYLYYMLRNPKVTDTDWEKYEDKVSGLVQDVNMRQSLQLGLHGMGRTGGYSIYSYLDRLDDAKQSGFMQNMFSVLLYIPAFGLCFYNLAFGIIAFFILAVYNIASYFRKRRDIEPYIVCFDYVYRVLDNCDSIIDTIKSKDKNILNEELNELEEIAGDFKAFKRFSSLVIGDAGTGPLAVILDYLKMLTHLDLMKFSSMLEQIKQNRDKIDQILGIIGRIDCYISIGEYRTYLKEWCAPALAEDNDEIIMEDIYHPLVSNAVKNSLSAKRSILLTGSNASGKSTFLKTVAVGAIMAQSIHTVCATKYNAVYYRIFTSLSLKDSIMSGESYYMVEIKSIKRIVDASKENGHVLGFVDEVLRGTNTTERIAASSSILKVLADSGVMVFAATHDLELTDILKADFDNYHFEEEMKDDDVIFPYTISKGKATGRNAIKLLGILGYDENITDRAKSMVENFEERQIWSITP